LTSFVVCIALVVEDVDCWGVPDIEVFFELLVPMNDTANADPEKAFDRHMVRRIPNVNGIQVGSSKMIERQRQVMAVGSVKVLVTNCKALYYVLDLLLYQCMVEARENVSCETAKHPETQDDGHERHVGEMLSTRKNILV
jgi:hypothetical protein